MLLSLLSGLQPALSPVLVMVKVTLSARLKADAASRIMTLTVPTLEMELAALVTSVSNAIEKSTSLNKDKAIFTQ